VRVQARGKKYGIQKSEEEKRYQQGIGGGVFCLLQGEVRGQYSTDTADEKQIRDC
jgi:hypothetical protein